MRVVFTALALGAALSFAAGDARAQTTLTRSDVVVRARAQAPRIVSARLALDEARGRLAGASLRLQENPEIDFTMGRRRAPDARYADLDLGVTQAFEPPGRRTARMDGASADIDHHAALADETIRIVLRDAVSAFYGALHASERIRILADAETLATRVYDVADRRFRAGDLAVLDVNTARAAVARARADREAAEAMQAAALGALGAILGLDETLQVRGTLAIDEGLDPAALAQALADRPELRAIDAEIREADADVQLARALARPDYSLGVRYQHEGQDRILLGGLTLTFPVFSSGQELRATGSARAVRLRADLDAARVQARIELRTALAVHERRANAVRLLEQDVLPELDENETLATRSFETGQIGLPDLLLFNREMLDVRLQHADALLEAALARVDVDAAAGVLR